MQNVKRNIYVVTHKGAPVAVATSKKRASEILSEIFKKEYKVTRFDNEQINQ
jgi:hypothetical protein